MATGLGTIRAAVANKLWLQRFPVVTTTTAASSNLTTVIVGGATYLSASANAYDGVRVYIASKQTGGPAIGEVAQVTSGGFTAASGTFTVSPAFTAPVQTNTKLIFHYGVAPESMRLAINRILAGLKGPAYIPLTLVKDGAMQDSGITDWSRLGTPAVVDKVSTPTEYILSGKQILHFTSAAINDGVQSNAISVHENEGLVFSAALATPRGSAKAELYNLTNASTIQSETISQYAMTEVRFTWPVPIGVKQVTARITAQTAVSDVYVAWVAIISRGRRWYDFPSQIAEPQDLWIPPLWELPLGEASAVTRTYIPLSVPFQPLSGQPEVDWQATDPRRITLPVAPLNPVFVKFYRNQPDLVSDSDTTDAPQDLVIAGTLATLKQGLADKAQGQNTKAALASEARQSLADYHHLLHEVFGLSKPRAKHRGQRRV